MPLTRWMSAVLWFYYMCIIEHDEKRFDIFQFLSFLLNQKLNCSKLFSKGRDKNFVFVRNLKQAQILYCELSQKCHTGRLGAWDDKKPKRPLHWADCRNVSICSLARTGKELPFVLTPAVVWDLTNICNVNHLVQQFTTAFLKSESQFQLAFF